MLKLNKNFWKNKKVLVTGHTGFTGTWIVHILLLLGSQVYGVSLHKNINSSIFKRSNAKVKQSYFDLCNQKKTKRLIKKIKPDIIFHLAAQSIIKSGIDKTYETYKTNFLGTLNVLESIENFEKKITLIVSTTDKVYLNQEKNIAFKEEDKLGAQDPYSTSKVIQDILSMSYFKNKMEKKKNFSLGIVRAGNIIGGGDMNKYRLIPDIIKYFYTNQKLIVRNLRAVRPWQHVIQASYGYLLVAENVFKNPNLSDAYNIGPFGKKHKVEEILKLFFRLKNLKFKSFNRKYESFKEARILFIDSSKAQKKLKYKEIISFKESLDLTFNWYEGYFKKKSIKSLIQNDLKKYFRF